MLLVIFCGIAALFAAIAAFSAYNKRKFYREHTQKMSAKVTSHRSVQLMGDKAYETIQGLWNPQIAAKRLYEFINDEKHDMNRYQEGPLSRA